MCSSDDRSIDCLDDDDDDDYDVPPAFRLDLSDVARLSSVVETEAWTTGDNARDNDNDNYDDDDYDVPPAFCVGSSDVTRLSDAFTTDGQDTNNDDDDEDDNYDVPPAFRLDLRNVEGRPSSFVDADLCDANSRDDDDNNYDVLPNCPTTHKVGCRSHTRSSDVDELYDYLTTKTFPDDDELNDYIATHSDDERRQLHGDARQTAANNQRIAADSSKPGDNELYDYPPPRRTSSNSWVIGSNEAGDRPSSATSVLDRQLSADDDLYDLVPHHPALFSNQLTTHKCSSPHSVVAAVESADENRYDLVATTKDSTKTVCLNTGHPCPPNVISEPSGASTDHTCDDFRVNRRKQSTSSQSSDDDHYDVLPCGLLDALSVRKTSVATTRSAQPLDVVLLTSCSTLPRSLPDRLNVDCSSMPCSDAVGYSVDTVSPSTSEQPQSSCATFAENRPLSGGMLTTVAYDA